MHKTLIRKRKVNIVSEMLGCVLVERSV